MHTVHTFGPQETIQAIIRKYNSMTLTREQISELIVTYNKLNGGQVPKPGHKVLIPLIDDTINNTKG